MYEMKLFWESIFETLYFLPIDPNGKYHIYRYVKIGAGKHYLNCKAGTHIWANRTDVEKSTSRAAWSKYWAHHIGPLWNQFIFEFGYYSSKTRGIPTWFNIQHCSFLFTLWICVFNSTLTLIKFAIKTLKIDSLITI